MSIRQSTVATKQLIILYHTMTHVILSVITRSIWTARPHHPCCGSDAMTRIICLYLRPTQVRQIMRVFKWSIPPQWERVVPLICWLHANDVEIGLSMWSNSDVAPRRNETSLCAHCCKKFRFHRSHPSQYKSARDRIAVRLYSSWVGVESKFYEIAWIPQVRWPLLITWYLRVPGEVIPTPSFW